jgi:hypothetical protein
LFALVFLGCALFDIQSASYRAFLSPFLLRRFALLLSRLVFASLCFCVALLSHTVHGRLSLKLSPRFSLA